MNEKIIQYRDLAVQYWSRFNKTQKWMIVGVVLSLLMTISIVSWKFSQTEYALAFTDLQPNDAASIKSYLDTAAIPYQLSADGKSIGVPRERVAEVKLNVVSQGLEKSGSLGYGIFRNNMSGFGVTENEFNVLKIDAVAGEIQMMLNQMTGVNSSKVLITMPKETVFLEKDEKAESSVAVVVNLKQGFQLDQGKIDTMYNLVAKSVPKLSYDNITISNQDGDLLPYSKSSTLATNGLSATQAATNFQIKKQYENDLQKNIKQLLGTMVGQNKVVVNVVSTLNFDQKNSKQQLVQPVVGEQGLPISREDISKSSNSDGGTVGGVPGTGETDVPNYPSANTSNQTNSEETQSRVNYEVSRIQNDIVSSPYVLKDLSVTVALEPSTGENSLTQDKIGEVNAFLMQIVRTSLAESGQQLTEELLQQRVSVFAHNFDGAQEVQDANPWTTYLMYGGIGLAVVLGVVIFFMARSRKKNKESNSIIEEELAPTPAHQPVGVIDLDAETDEMQVRKQLESLAKTKPEEFVKLLRTWIIEE